MSRDSKIANSSWVVILYSLTWVQVKRITIEWITKAMKQFKSRFLIGLMLILLLCFAVTFKGSFFFY